MYVIQGDPSAVTGRWFSGNSATSTGRCQGVGVMAAFPEAVDESTGGTTETPVVTWRSWRMAVFGVGRKWPTSNHSTPAGLIGC
jgi:hypothetical protein